MAYRQKTSPFKQKTEVDPNADKGKKTNAAKDNSSKPGFDFDRAAKSLKESNTNTAGAKTIGQANRRNQSISSKLSNDLDNMHPVGKAVIQLTDPTGVSSWGDAKKALNDGKLNSDDAIETFSALPVIGKVPKLIGKTIKLAKSLSAVERVAKAGAKINNVTSKINKANKLSNQEKVAEAIIPASRSKKKTKAIYVTKK